MKLKIGFYPLGDKSWYAGTSFLANLLKAIKYTYRDRVETCIIHKIAQPDVDSTLISISDSNITVPYLKKGNLSRLINKVSKQFFSRDLESEGTFRKNNIDAVFGNLLNHRCNKVPMLSWICDFQHVHLPDMFDPIERLNRTRLFYRSAKISSRIIVKSESIRKDFEKYIPRYAGKVRVIKLACDIPEAIYRTRPEFIVDLYRLPEKFIYFPSQFWKHKNHEIAFRAVRTLKKMGEKITIVTSGYPEDYRHPSHFKDLFQKVYRWNIKDQIIYLGMVPYEYVLLLMRQSICLLNPSLFEGFGMTVAEAKSMGKKVLLSDILPHREHASPVATFFDPRDAGDLTEKMSRIWRQTEPGPDLGLEEKARKSLPRRMAESAESFVSIVKEIVNNR